MTVSEYIVRLMHWVEAVGNEYGWLANIIGIVTAILTIFAAIRCVYKKFCQKDVPVGVYDKQNNSNRPIQKPRRHKKFQGRKAEVRKVSNFLRPKIVFAIYGPGGMGKTALAAEVIEAVFPADEGSRMFPDGLVSHSFYGQPSADSALASLASAYGEVITPQLTPRDAARKALSGKQALLYLDGAEVADDLRPIFSVAENCCILFTSRQKIEAVDHWLDLTALSNKEAELLLMGWGGGSVKAGRVSRRICSLVGNLPLAIRLAGRHIDKSGCSPQEFLQWLTNAPLEALDQGARQHESIPLLIQKSLERLRPGSIFLMRMFGALSLAPVTTQFLVCFAELDQPTLQRSLIELSDFGLLVRNDGSWQVAHLLIHTYAAERIAADRQMLEKLSTALSSAAGRMLGQNSSVAQQYLLLRPHMLRLLTVLADKRLWRQYIQLASATSTHLFCLGLFNDYHSTMQRILDTNDPVVTTEDRWKARGSLINIYNAAGMAEQAVPLLEENLKISRNFFRRACHATDLSNLGIAYCELRKFPEAKKCLEQAIAIFKSEKHDPLAENQLYNTLGTLAITLREMGELRSSTSISEEILRREGGSAERGSLSRQATQFSNLALVKREQFRKDSSKSFLAEAIRYLETAVDLDLRASEFVGAACQCRNLGDTQLDNCRPDLAEDAYVKARILYEKMGLTDSAEDVQRKIDSIKGE